MKRYLTAWLCMFLLFSTILLLFFLWNRTTPLLAQEDTIPEDIAATAYVLSPLRADADGSYRITLHSNAGRDDLTLVLAAMRPFSLQVNGTHRYTYDAASPYQRMHVIPLPEAASCDTLELCILSPSGQSWLKALLTTDAENSRLLTTALVISAVSIGIHLMALFSCLSLYLWKRSERYLLAQFFAASITLVSALLTSGIFSLPLSDSLYVQIQYLADSARIPTWTAVCLLLIPQEYFPAKIPRLRIFPLWTAAVALLWGADILHLNLCYELLYCTFFLIGALALAHAVIRRIPGMRLVCLVYLFYCALTMYIRLTNLALLPNTKILVYLYTPPLGSLLLLSACMLAVNRRFAGKFSQADRLVGELEDINAGLDAKVEERTAQLRLQQEQRRSMMVNIFHDLRSPLFSARGCADMLSPHDENDAECLAVIRDKLDFLSTLTEQLFLMAKLEDGKITFARSDVPLLDLCRSIAGETALDAAQAGIRFTFSGDTPLVVTGDAFRLKQALENLLENARKFTPEGGLISLSLTRAGERALLQVRDTGKGIAAQDLPHVFERYYQGRNTDKQRSTGLGLSIAREIILAHGGSITVDSREGGGTCFSILLPLSESGGSEA